MGNRPAVRGTGEEMPVSGGAPQPAATAAPFALTDPSPGAVPDARVHDLLRVARPLEVLQPAGPAGAGGSWPDWARRSLEAAPWVVVRRAPRALDGALPVGVRGSDRAERLAAWLPPEGHGAVRDRLTPEELPPRAGRLASQRRAAVAAFGQLAAAEALFTEHRLPYGPAGSVAFELASGQPAAHPGSDLDLVVRAPTPLPRAAAAVLHDALGGLPVRTDTLLETPQGAVALAEYAQATEDTPVLLRTAGGPQLVPDPWRSPHSDPHAPASR